MGPCYDCNDTTCTEATKCQEPYFMVHTSNPHVATLVQRLLETLSGTLTTEKQTFNENRKQMQRSKNIANEETQSKASKILFMYSDQYFKNRIERLSGLCSNYLKFVVRQDVEKSDVIDGHHKDELVLSIASNYEGNNELLEFIVSILQPDKRHDDVISYRIPQISVSERMSNVQPDCNTACVKEYGTTSYGVDNDAGCSCYKADMSIFDDLADIMRKREFVQKLRGVQMSYARETGRNIFSATKAPKA